MGLFDFFKKKANDANEDKATGTNPKPETLDSINDPGSNLDNDDIIEQDIEVNDFGGAKPSLTLRKSGRIYLIVEVPPFYDGDGKEIDGDKDFPEVLEFESLISEYSGVQVDREDREVFVINKPKTDTLLKVKDFMENYWTLRKDKYKKS
ncbi:MAG: hypothetical protein ACOYXT_26725 [Bacteroidota bacterium]